MFEKQNRMVVKAHLKLAVSAIVFSLIQSIMCEMTCTEPLRIQEPVPIEIDLKMELYNIEVHEYPSKVSGGYVARRRWVNYCYDGSSIDPNTRCYPKLQNKLPTFKEAVEWLNRGECPIGHICEPDGDCWGSDSKKCFEESTIQWVSSSNLKWVGTRYFMFPHHTCISTWECKQHRMELPITAVIKSGVITPLIPLSNGTMQPIPAKVDQPIVLSDFEALYLLDKPSPSTDVTKANCVSSPNQVACVVNDPLNKHHMVPFTLTEGSKCSSYRNAIFCLREFPQGWLEQGVLREASNVNDELYQGTSIKSTEEIITDLRVSNLQNNYNTLQIASAIIRIYKVLDKALYSLGKIDDELFGNIFGWSLSTKWITKDTLRLCKKKSMEYDGHCYYDSQFNLGRYSTITRPCISANEEFVSNITLFDELNFARIEYLIEDPESTSDHLDGWSWVADHRADILKVIGASESKQYDGNTSYTAGFSIFELINKYLLYITFFLCIVNTIYIFLLKR